MSAASDKAVAYLLNRIVRDPRLAYHFDPLTESYELLTAAHAEAVGQGIADFRTAYQAMMKFERPKCSDCGNQT